jgi:hypothetical protein
VQRDRAELPGVQVERAQVVAGNFGGAGHVAGALLALQGVTDENAVPGRNGPVTTLRVSAPLSVT